MKKFTVIKKSSVKNPKLIKENVKIPPMNQPENYAMEPNGEKSDIVKFFSKLFEAREMAHIYHLQVKGEDGSFSKHEALGEYYEELIKLVDELIEVYMGQYDVVEGYESIDTNPSKSVDPIEYFNGISSYIMSEKKKCISEEDTHILSIIDDIHVITYRLLYKLKYTK